MSSASIPNPIRICCTECHRDASVRYQAHEVNGDILIVAAECDCGRFLGIVDTCMLIRLLRYDVPLIAHSLKHDPEIGNESKARIADLRARIEEHERRIAAATWAQERLRP